MIWNVGYVYGGGKFGTMKSFGVTYKDGRLRGSWRSNHDDTGWLLGSVEAKDGKVTRFDLVVKGPGRWVEDCGFSAGLRMIPRGITADVGVLFTLADPRDELARVPPFRVNYAGYLK